MSASLPLKICMVTSFYPPYNLGGDGILIYHLSNALAALGHKVDIVHSVDAYLAKRKTLNEGEWPQHQNVRVHRLKSRAGVWAPTLGWLTGKPLMQRKAIEQIFKENTYDVTHFHTVSLIGGPGIFELGHGVKLKTLHTHWLVCPTSYLFRNEKEICRKRTCMSCTALSYKRPPQLWRNTSLMSRSLNRLDALIAPSQTQKQLHQDLGIKNRIEYIPNFTTFGEELKENENPRLAATDTPYFLYTGQLTFNKGVHVLIEAFKRSKTPYALKIVGSGPYAETLKALAGDDDRIQFEGQKHIEDIKQLYRQAAALVVPSLWYEVGPVTAMEGMAYGLPLIVHNMGGMREIVERSQAGFTYETVDELTQILDSYEADSSEVKAFSLKARKTQQQAFSTSEHIKQYLALIEELREQKKAMGASVHVR